MKWTGFHSGTPAQMSATLTVRALCAGVVAIAETNALVDHETIRYPCNKFKTDLPTN